MNENIYVIQIRLGTQWMDYATSLTVKGTRAILNNHPNDEMRAIKGNKTYLNADALYHYNAEDTAKMLNKLEDLYLKSGDTRKQIWDWLATERINCYQCYNEILNFMEKLD